MSIWNSSPHYSVRGLILSPDEKSICLIRREKKNQLYYVAPGGGLEKGEAIEVGLVREIHEETGLHIAEAVRLGAIQFEGRLQVYFAAKATSLFLRPQGEESSLLWQRENGLFHPEWIEIAKIESVPVVSVFIRDLIRDYPTRGWPQVEFKLTEKVRATQSFKVG